MGIFLRTEMEGARVEMAVFNFNPNWLFSNYFTYVAGQRLSGLGGSSFKVIPIIPVTLVE